MTQSPMCKDRANWVCFCSLRMVMIRWLPVTAKRASPARSSTISVSCFGCVLGAARLSYFLMSGTWSILGAHRKSIPKSCFFKTPSWTAPFWEYKLVLYEPIFGSLRIPVGAKMGPRIIREKLSLENKCFLMILAKRPMHQLQSIWAPFSHMFDDFRILPHFLASFSMFSMLLALTFETNIAKPGLRPPIQLKQETSKRSSANLPRYARNCQNQNARIQHSAHLKWPLCGGSRRREPSMYKKQHRKSCWSRNTSFSHGFAPFFVCAKL